MGIIICPPPAEKSLHPRAYVHPGFGSVEIRRNGKQIHYDIRGDGRGGPMTAGGLARRFVKGSGKYELLVDGPLVSYDYKWSRAQKAWVLVQRRKGFA